MKKQLIAAAVAATMTSVAMADLSITGAAKMNYTYTDDNANVGTNAFVNNGDLKIKGTHGDSTVVMNMGTDTGAGAGQITLEDTYFKTSVSGLGLKVGDWDNGNNNLRASGRTANKFQANYSVGDLGLQYNASGDAGTDQTKITYTVAGWKAGYQTNGGNGENLSLSGTVAGVTLAYIGYNRDVSTTERSSITASASFEGVGIKIGKATADTGATIEGDTWMGDYEGASGAYALSAGQDVTAVELSTSLSGNTVKFRHASVDDVAGSDMSFNKVIVTRKLGNGTTFEAVYTSTDDSTAANDADVLDLELAVSF